MYSRFYNEMYYLLKDIEFGSDFENEKSRSYQTVISMSFLELFNVMSLFPLIIKGYVIVIPFFLIIVTNCLIFLVNGRYKKIIYNKPLSKSFIIVYIAVTAILFITTRLLYE